MRLRLLTLSTIVISIALLGSCVPDRSETIPAEMAKQIAMMPASANAMGYINFEELKKSSFYEMFQNSEHMPEFEDELNEFIEDTGFDIRENLHEVYLAGQISNRDEPKDMLVVARGDFDTKKIMAYIENKAHSEKLSKETIEDNDVYLIDEKDKAFCFADAHTLIAGGSAQVKEWLQKQSGNSNKTSAKPEIADAIKQLKYKRGMWFTMNATSLLEGIDDSDLKKLKGLKSVRNLSFSALLDEHFNFSSTGEFSDHENAELFKDAVKGIIATGKLSMSDEREVIDILNKIDVETKKNTIRVQFQMAREEIEKLMDKKEKLQQKII